jgi:hypothetical protein
MTTCSETLKPASAEANTAISLAFSAIEMRQRDNNSRLAQQNRHAQIPKNWLAF